MIRVAAVADLHFGTDSAGTYRPQLERLAERADLFLIGGDLTQMGKPEEADVLSDELADLPVPTVAVLGNHDHHWDQEDKVRAAMERAGIVVVEGDSTVVDVDGVTVGVAGTKGFGGGFAGAHASDFGERETKAFIRTTMDLAAKLEGALRYLDTDIRIALMHYAPVHETLEGEPLEIYPFLGSYLLGEAIDREGADLVIHGHAHRGRERAQTPGGINVRNVALPVLRQAYALYELEGGASGAGDTARARSAGR